jgi:molecular chaperone GrpE
VTDAPRQPTPARTVQDVPPTGDARPEPDTPAREEVPADPTAAPDAETTGHDEPATGRDEQATGHVEQAAGDDVQADADHTDLVAVAAADPRTRAELVGDLLEAEAKRDEYLDDLRRSHAELDNFRKRVLRDSAAQRDRGRADVAAALLEVLDDLDRTLVAARDSEDPGLAKGVELVASKLATALHSIGLQRIDTAEVTFDPTVHEAVQHVAAEEPTPEPVVEQVLRPGYQLGDRTLRAAMVVVRG